MSTIKANNYEASTAGNNLIFKTNNAERMRIDTSGNLTLSSGNLTLSSGSLSGTVQRGSYGSLSVSGSTNTYSGIDFTAANATFMIRTSDKLSGVYKDNNTWAYYIDGSGNYYSGEGLCPQTTVSPTLAAHLTRKDYVDSRVANGTSIPIGAIIMMQIYNTSGNTFLFTSATCTQSNISYSSTTDPATTGTSGPAYTYVASGGNVSTGTYRIIGQFFCATSSGATTRNKITLVQRIS